MKFLFLSSLLVLPGAWFLYVIHKKPSVQSSRKLQCVDEIVALFPTTKKATDELVNRVIQESEASLQAIYTVNPAERTFENTMRPYDALFRGFYTAEALCKTITVLHPDAEMRKAAQDNVVKLEAFVIDSFSQSAELFKACQEYEHLLKDPAIAAKEALTAEEAYLVKEVMQSFRRTGLSLPNETQEHIKAIKKKISSLETQFESHITSDHSSIVVMREELAGWDDADIDALEKTKEGYVLDTSVPIYAKIFEKCSVSSTREKYYMLFMRRAYPVNEPILSSLIDLRDELARLLGYKSYAHFDIDNQMAQTPERVLSFIEDVAEKCRPIAEKELALLKKDLPEGVVLTKEGTLYPWDYLYTHRLYKKKYLNFDESVLDNYFPFEHVLSSVLSLYETFFGLTFKKMSEKVSLWDPALMLFAVYKAGEYRGMIIADFFSHHIKRVPHLLHRWFLLSAIKGDTFLPQ